MPGIQLEQADLIRTFAIQAPPRLMLFLGAGASASAGILTAADMIWQFKREIYCSETGASKEAFKDLHVESQRKRLQAYFDQKGTYPLLWDDREYSVYFERCYPHPQERRAFIRRALQDGTPS